MRASSLCHGELLKCRQVCAVRKIRSETGVWEERSVARVQIRIIGQSAWCVMVAVAKVLKLQLSTSAAHARSDVVW